VLGQLLQGGLAAPQVDQQRGGDEDRGVGTDGDTDEQRQGQVEQRAWTELGEADHEDGEDRQQGHDRRVDRPHEGLVDREVGRLGVGLNRRLPIASAVFSRTLSKTTTVS
jgi:hypothetical protein